MEKSVESLADGELLIYLEYLENLETVSLIVSSSSLTLVEISDAKINEDNVKLIVVDRSCGEAESERKERTIVVNFADFKVDKSASAVTARNKKISETCYETSFKLKVSCVAERKDEAFEETGDQLMLKNGFLTRLVCSGCNKSLLRTEEKLQVLSLPDNELDELADNFFCHLHDHDHCHGHGENTKNENAHLANELNPLRNKAKLRKSVLENMTVFIMNKNHLDLEAVRVNDSGKSQQIECAGCSYPLGYKERNNANDFFIWKFNTLYNANADRVDLLQSLEQGRYLVETRSSDKDWLYVWVLSDNLSVQTRKLNCRLLEKLNLVSVRLAPSGIGEERRRFSKRLMYAFGAADSPQTVLNSNKLEFKTLKNDLNLSNLTVSKENLDSLLKRLAAANENLCESLKPTLNGYKFALV